MSLNCSKIGKNFVFFGYAIFEPHEQYKIQRKTALLKCGVSFGGSGWIRTSSGLSQQIYSLPRLSNSGARPILGAGSGNRTRISSLEGLHTSLCTMPATNSKPCDYILNENKIKNKVKIG